MVNWMAFHINIRININMCSSNFENIVKIYVKQDLVIKVLTVIRLIVVFWQKKLNCFFLNKWWWISEDLWKCLLKRLIAWKCSTLLALLLLSSFETKCLSLCFWLVPLRGKTQLEPHPDCLPFTGSIEVFRWASTPFYMGAPLPPPERIALQLNFL